jgi:nicotinamidase-related amidase
MMFSPPSTALLVIDMQRDFLHPNGYAARAGLDGARLRAAIGPLGKVLDAARAARLTVIHTREGHLPDLSDCPPAKLERSQRAGAAIGTKGPLGRFLIRGEYGHDFVDELRPRATETVIDKPGYSAFSRTALQQNLEARRIDTLIITGVTTEVCVSSTLRDAVDRGYRCLTVGDACASSDPDLHRAALAMIGVEGGIFGALTTSRELIAELRTAAVA